MPSRIRIGKLHEYDARDSTLMINGHLIKGFSENSMFTIQDDQDSATLKIDPQGTPTKSRNNSTSGTMTIPLDETSPSNALLLKYFNEDTVFPVDLITSTAHVSTTYAFITKRANLEGQKAASDRSWNIKLINYEETATIDYEE